MSRFTKDFPERPMTQLNMRVSTLTADAFRAYCAEHQLTQNEALSILLTSKNFRDQATAEDAYLEEIHRYQDTITELECKYNTLLEQVRTREKSDWQKAKDWASIMRQLLNFVIERAELGTPPGKKNYFNRDHKKVQFDLYNYPSGSGCAVVRMDAVLYGRGSTPAQFLLASHTVEEDGSLERVKLRYYPRSRFVGLSPSATKYCHPGALWAIGYMPAPDGAAELIAALPLDAIVRSTALQDALKQVPRLEGLDALIADAEQRRGKK